MITTWEKVNWKCWLKMWNCWLNFENCQLLSWESIIEGFSGKLDSVILPLYFASLSAQLVHIVDLYALRVYRGLHIAYMFTKVTKIPAILKRSSTVDKMISGDGVIQESWCFGDFLILWGYQMSWNCTLCSLFCLFNVTALIQLCSRTALILMKFMVQLPPLSCVSIPTKEPCCTLLDELNTMNEAVLKDWN